MPTPTLTSAEYTLDSLYTTTWQSVKKQVTDQIFNATPFFYEMYKGENIEREDGGRYIEEPLMYGKNATIAWIDKGGTISIADTDPLTTSTWNWRNLAGTVVRMWADDMANSGIHKKIDLMNAKIENLRLSLIDQLEINLFTAQAGSAMSGIPDIIQAALPAAQSLSPGGLSKSTYPWWRNQYFVSTGSFAAFGKSDMRTMYNNCSIGNDHPNLILTEQTVFEFYEAEAEDIQRINDSSAANLGFQTFRYKGANMYYSPQCPTGYIYFLNLKYLKLKIDSKADFDMTEWKVIPNQLDRVAQVVSRMELVSRNNRMQGLIGGITVA
jgi:hypothetical protein